MRTDRHATADAHGFLDPRKGSHDAPETCRGKQLGPPLRIELPHVPTLVLGDIGQLAEVVTQLDLHTGGSSDRLDGLHAAASRATHDCIDTSNGRREHGCLASAQVGQRPEILIRRPLGAVASVRMGHDDKDGKGSKHEVTSFRSHRLIPRQRC